MNENDSNEINLNGVIYVRKDSITETKPVNTEGMPYVICRGHECGVHAGYLKNHDGNHATLVKSRRRHCVLHQRQQVPDEPCKDYRHGRTRSSAFAIRQFL